MLLISDFGQAPLIRHCNLEEGDVLASRVVHETLFAAQRYFLDCTMAKEGL